MGFIGVRWCPLVSAGVRWGLLGSAGVRWGPLVSAGVRRVCLGPLGMVRRCPLESVGIGQGSSGSVVGRQGPSGVWGLFGVHHRYIGIIQGVYLGSVEVFWLIGVKEIETFFNLKIFRIRWHFETIGGLFGFKSCQI